VWGLWMSCVGFHVRENGVCSRFYRTSGPTSESLRPLEINHREKHHI
jgi:hypothetical protein